MLIRQLIGCEINMIMGLAALPLGQPDETGANLGRWPLTPVVQAGLSSPTGLR
jgi:hypothetical protein